MVLERRQSRTNWELPSPGLLATATGRCCSGWAVCYTAQPQSVDIWLLKRFGIAPESPLPRRPCNHLFRGQDWKGRLRERAAIDSGQC